MSPKQATRLLRNAGFSPTEAEAVEEAFRGTLLDSEPWNLPEVLYEAAVRYMAAGRDPEAFTGLLSRFFDELLRISLQTYRELGGLDSRRKPKPPDEPNPKYARHYEALRSVLDRGGAA